MFDVSVTELRIVATAAGHSDKPDVARALVRHEDAGVRAAALGALARLGALTAAELEAGLADRDPSVRRRAAELAGGPAVEVPAPRLAGLVGDADALVAEAACWALGERGDRGAVPALCEAAGGHGDPLVREAAVAALGAVGDPAGLDAILAACSDKPAIRRRAVLALAPFEGPEVDQALDRASRDRDWQVRQAAEDLQGR